MILAGDRPEALETFGAAARAAGWTTFLADAGGGPGEGSDHLPWNPASYVSAGALALAASARAEIEALVLLSAPERGERSLFDGPPGSLATAAEALALGPLWLGREFVRRFEARKSGKILLVSVEPPAAETAAPGQESWPAYAAASFRGFGEALFDRGRGAPWKAWGIVDKSGKPEALAAFALALLEEAKEAKTGRWLSFSGKAGLFGIF